MADNPYHDRRWPALRLQILERDRYRCCIQLDGCTTQADRVDHIQNWKQGGDWFDPANLQAACRSCNTAKRYQGDRQPVRSSRDW